MSDVPTRPRPEDRRCPACGSADLEEGYLEDEGEYSRGFVKWIAGPVVKGRLGKVKISSSTPRWMVDALRCPLCGHLSLYANRRA